MNIISKTLTLAFIALLLPAMCTAEEPFEDQIQDALESNAMGAQTIDLRDNKDERGFFERYMPDILIIIGAVGAIESLLWAARSRKKPNID